MKYKIEIIDTQSEDFIIYAKQDSETLLMIEKLLAENCHTVFGYGDNEVIKLDASSVYCFFTEGNKTYALTESGKLHIKDRLYRLEEIFSKSFVKINQSCLVNVSKIKKFESSIGGSLSVILEGGYKDYISRRQLKAVKERMGI